MCFDRQVFSFEVRDKINVITDKLVAAAICVVPRYSKP